MATPREKKPAVSAKAKDEQAKDIAGLVLHRDRHPSFLLPSDKFSTGKSKKFKNAYKRTTAAYDCQPFKDLAKLLVALCVKTEMNVTHLANNTRLEAIKRNLTIGPDTRCHHRRDDSEHTIAARLRQPTAASERLRCGGRTYSAVFVISSLMMHLWIP
ncbi:hypothetical protein EVAR_89645_1 [Eumeta japonica]|uniref:Uncharacterized protein n=1 Tax=Eumeta variegata TaxID=151549 RepID=A0A4C1Z9U2_EUMVA|nr:hypothetical protein EVAR_89645_1 [Eumeta japonica]